MTYLRPLVDPGIPMVHEIFEDRMLLLVESGIRFPVSPLLLAVVGGTGEFQFGGSGLLVNYIWPQEMVP